MSVALVRVAGPGEDDKILNQNDVKIPLTLPAILGRGSLLKCGERKLSRRHACLDWDDDDLLLTSTHQNPTYVIVAGEEKQLSNGDSVQISHGDKFGLMQNGFWYRLTWSKIDVERDESPNDTSADKDTSKAADGEQAGQNENTVENGQDEATKTSRKENESNGINNNVDVDIAQEKEEEGELEKQNEAEENEVVETVEEKPKDVPNGCSDDKDLDGSKATTQGGKVPQNLQSAALPRKRNLPSWLLKASPKKPEVGESPQTSTKYTHGSDRKRTTNAKRKQPDNGETTPSKVKRQAVDDKDVTPTKKVKSPTKPKPSKNHELSDESDDEGQRNGQKRTNQNTPRKDVKQSPSPRKSPAAKKSPLKNASRVLHDMSDESSDDDDNAGQSSDIAPARKNTRSPAQKKKPLSRQPESDDETQGTPAKNTGAAASATPSPVKRKKRARRSCQYGANCYRKNPSHKAQFAHVGDSDYQEEESASDDPDDDRPQCEHGIDCYRTNKKHRNEYRHSRVPQPKRRAKYKAQKKKGDGEGDSEDEYDNDDPFLNDESSDDYAPTDSDSDSPLEDAEEEDNTSRMLKEAKKFIRKRR
ncbi:aprataxin and PNK-like factor isoform X2 [Penaeus japonicus]|nr:aprataxin and PNK-like factor isoform X2 [Penaeus japonicus]